MICMHAIFSNFKHKLSSFMVFVLFLGSVACVEKQADNASVSPLLLDTVAANPVFAAVHFDPQHAYSAPVCLQFQGKPLLTIGQNIRDLNPLVLKNRDPNGPNQDQWNVVFDYYCIEDEYILAMPGGSFNGMTYLSTDSLGTIFALSQSWYMDGGETQESQHEALRRLRKTVFPCTSSMLNFGEKKRFVLVHEDFDEVFELYAEEGRAFEDGGWHLQYEVVLTPLARRE